MSEELYKYLTKGRGLNAEQKRMIRNAADYAEKFDSPGEKASFLLMMLKGMYSKDKKPVITPKKIRELQKKTKRVRVWRTTTKVITRVQVQYADIECAEDAEENELIEMAETMRRWCNVNIEDENTAEEKAYRVDDGSAIKKELEDAANTRVVVSDRKTGKATVKRFGDLEPGDRVTDSKSGNAYIITRYPSAAKNRMADLRVSAKYEKQNYSVGRLRPDELVQPKQQ